MRDMMPQQAQINRTRRSALMDGQKAQTAAASASILLVEDDETLATLLARVLRNEGYHVDLLDRADQLPGEAKLGKYDVVLSDIHLAGGTSGQDVLKQVRAASERIPDILM